MRVTRPGLYLMGCMATLFAVCCYSPNAEIDPEVKVNLDRFHHNQGYNLAEPVVRLILPTVLREISGLSFYKKDTLVCVQDELGYVFFYDLAKQDLVDRIRFAKNGDYEGIEAVGNDLFIVKSNGDLFRLSMQTRETEVIKTPLKAANNVEGLGYHPRTDHLLLACKDQPGTSDGSLKGKAVYFYQLNQEFPANPSFLLTGDHLKQWVKVHEVEWNLDKKVLGFKPSAIAVHPLTNDLYILASVGRILLVTDQLGVLKDATPLPAHLYYQPEGICFAPNGDLYISNEARGAPASIMSFKYEK